MKTFFRFLLVVFYIFFLTLTSCSSDDSMVSPEEEIMTPEEEEESNLTAYQQDVVDYFKEVALGFEFGNASRITRKWEVTMKIYVEGNASDELLAELDKIIAELDELTTDDFSIEFVDNFTESNYHIFFGSSSNYAALYPRIANLVESNWGLFSLYWDEANQLNRGHMYVDTRRANAVEQKHLLREELTQSLGLAVDSNKYRESIFQAAWTRTTSYAEIDKELIRLLYHPDMTSGLNRFTVEPVLVDILTNQ